MSLFQSIAEQFKSFGKSALDTSTTLLSKIPAVQNIASAVTKPNLLEGVSNYFSTLKNPIGEEIVKNVGKKPSQMTFKEQDTNTVGFITPEGGQIKKQTLNKLKNLDEVKDTATNFLNKIIKENGNNARFPVNAVDDATNALENLMKNNATQDDLLNALEIARLHGGPEVSRHLDELVQKSSELPKIPIVDKTPALDLRPGMKERGFITSAKEVIPEADKIAGQYVPRATDPLAMKAKNLIADNVDIALNKAMTSIDDEAVATASELIKHYGDEAAKTTDKAIQTALYDKAAEVANTIAPKLTEAGRTIQAASILGRLTPEGQVRFAASQIAKYNETLPLTRRIPGLTGEQAQNIVNEMKAINLLPDGIEKAMRFQKVQNFITDLVPTPLFKKILTVWKAGLLTGVKTSGVNIFANTSHQATEIAKDIPATIVDQVTSLFTGKRTKTFSLKGLFGGGAEGIDKGLQYIKTGFDERNIGTKLDYNRINFGEGKIAKALQTYTESVFRILGAEDQPFYYASKLRSLYEQAKVAAINKGLSGEAAQTFINKLIQSPTDDMLRYAALDAETAVFQNPTALGRAARAIQDIGGGAGEIVVPFGKTPSAVVTQVINYSPIGIAKPIFQAVVKGNFDQRLFSQAVGRGLTGTAVLGLGALMYKKGLVTTSRPTGEKEQKLWELEGKQPNSIKIGGKWRQVQVLGPVGNLLLIGGGFQKAFDNSGSLSEAAATGLADASKSFTQQTFLTGVSNFIDAVSDPARSAKSVAGSTLASTVPTIIGDIARATDTKERRTEEIINKLQARIPGVRETLEPQVNVLGQERPTTGNPLEILADPTRPSPEQNTPVIQEIRRLWDAGYKVSPTLLGDSGGYKGLTKQQNTELWKKAGEITNEKLTSLFSKQEYQSLSDDQKGKIVSDVVDKSKVVARAGMVIQLTDGLQGSELLNKLSELKSTGLITKEVFDRYKELR